MAITISDPNKKKARRPVASVSHQADIPADFAESRTIQQLAEEQRRFIATIDDSGEEYISLDLEAFDQVMGSPAEISMKRREGILSSSAWEVLEDL